MRLMEEGEPTPLAKIELRRLKGVAAWWGKTDPGPVASYEPDHGKKTRLRHRAWGFGRKKGLARGKLRKKATDSKDQPVAQAKRGVMAEKARERDRNERGRLAGSPR